MAEHDDIGDVNLLEWSHELDRALLHLPFKPLQPTTDDGRALFLFKLAYSSKCKEAGLLLLDCDACTAFYEGVSLRTLDRRTRVGTAANGTADADHLQNIVAGIHHSLDPQTALDTSLRTTIGLESTRFSSSVSISVKSRQDDAENNFKSSFDLDPLDHASLSNMLSSHFVRPLLGLATVLAQSASQSQLDSIQNVKAESSNKQSTSSDSLELIRRSALSHAGLPVNLRHPLSNGASGQDASKGKASTPPPKSKHMVASEVKLSASTFDDASYTDDLDDDAELLLFGPPGCRLPSSRQKERKGSAKVKQEPRSSSPIYPPCSDNDDDGDATLTAPPAKAESRASLYESPLKGASVKSKTAVAEVDGDDSDSTSEEESLPMHSTSDAEQDPKQPSTRFQKGITNSTREGAIASENPKAKLIKEKAREPPSEKMPDMTPPAPPSTFTPSASQITPSTREAEREQQRRRREEIARLKRGQSTQSTQGSSTSKASIPTSSGRKRSRF